MLNKAKNTATRAARQAGKELLGHFLKLKESDISFKRFHETVTKEDVKAEKIIIKEIKRIFPDHNILSEERGLIDKGSDYTWIIDPLDGTNNYVRGNPLFGVSIALARGKQVQLGVIYIPYLKEMYTAELSKGAYKNEKKIKVSKVKSLKDSLFLYCHGYEAKYKKKDVAITSVIDPQIRISRRLGSAVVELAYVANGRAEGYTYCGTKLWDVAAGALLVREAGGQVSDFTGADWQFSSTNLLATNGLVHQQIVNRAKKVI